MWQSAEIFTTFVRKISTMKQHILVTGANGQLGKSLQDVSAEPQFKHHYFFTDVETLDITQLADIQHFVKENNITTIINAAAYTAVDKAENDVENAFQINEFAVKNLAQVSKENDLFLLHISTDYVFDGRAKTPLRPEDAVNPQSVYGKSKAAGEQAIAAAQVNAAIVRTSWLYSQYGNNFLKTMLRLGSQRPEIQVVSDQFGAPTFARDLATALLTIVNNAPQIHGTEIFHFANTGCISWADFAAGIMKMAKLPCKVRPISTEQYGAVAPRPAYSCFNLQKISTQFNLPLRDWKEALYECNSLIIN